MMKQTMMTMRRWLAACGLAAAAVAAPLHAEVLDFEHVAPTALLGGESLLDNGYLFTALEGPFTAAYGLHSGTGAVLDPYDPGTCDVTACPGGASGNFYAGLNDGGLQLSRTDGKAFSLSGLDFAFLAPMPMIEPLSGQLLVSGTRSGGASVALLLDFAGQDALGHFQFSSAALDAFSGIQFNQVVFSACLFIDEACVNSLDQPAFNEAQFALDNINVSAVPEPSSWAMLFVGLALLGVQLLRQRRTGALKPLLRSVLAAALLAGATQAAQAEVISFRGDTTGGPTYLRTNDTGTGYDDWRGAVAYRVYDIDLKEYASMISFAAMCDFDCGIFVYEGSFDPHQPFQHFMGGADYYAGYTSGMLNGHLLAGHYSMVVVGDSTPEFGAFAGVVAADAAFTVSAVPEPSTWMLLGAGLALLAVTRCRGQWGRGLRLGLAAAVLMVGATQSARATVTVIDGDTTFADSFDSPLSDTWGADVHYNAFKISVGPDWTYKQGILVACEFDCVLMLYHSAFDTKNSDQNLYDLMARSGGVQRISSHLDEGETYFLVVTGRYDYDWGKYSLLIGNPTAISISAVPEPTEWGMLLGGLGLVGAIARRRRS
jgi:hypothetical protein